MKPQRMMRALMIFAPVLFAGGSGNPILWLKLVVAFFIFALLTGTICIIDDIADYESDKKNSGKKESPITTGELSINKAEFAVGSILVACFVSAFFIGPAFGAATMGYFFVEMCYYLLLKDIPIVDAMTVAVETSLTVIAGAVALGLALPSWLLVFTLSFATLVNFADKKRSFLSYRRSMTGLVLSRYDKKTLEQLVSVNASVAIMLYIFICVLMPGANPLLWLTLPLVMYIVYKVVVLSNATSEVSIEKAMIKDRSIWLSLFIWAVFLLVFPSRFV